MTGPHLTHELEAEIRARSETSLSISAFSVRALLAALDAERAAHNLTRTALQASTELLITLLRRHGVEHMARLTVDERVQANQVVLGLAVAEADKPHHGTER